MHPEERNLVNQITALEENSEKLREAVAEARQELKRASLVLGYIKVVHEKAFEDAMHWLKKEEKNDKKSLKNVS